jgi:hypothetical protein
MLPLGCLPLWGREGVTLIAFPKEWRMTGFLQSHDFNFYLNLRGAPSESTSLSKMEDIDIPTIVLHLNYPVISFR